MKLLLVDGSNLVMRAAFGGDIEPKFAVPTATGLIRRAMQLTAASHLVVALDTPGEPSWRKQLLPTYKAHRTLDTGRWLTAAHAEWTRRGWCVEDCVGFEADDVIATLALRAKDRAEVIVCSSDSDLLQLTAEGFAVLRPMNGGKFETWHAAEVCAKYQLQHAGQLRDLKALMGESGDNIPGVPGIGPVKAAKLLTAHKDFASLLTACFNPGATDKDLQKVAQHLATVQLALRLVSLRDDVPLLPLKPSACAYADRTLFSNHQPD